MAQYRKNLRKKARQAHQAGDMMEGMLKYCREMAKKSCKDEYRAIKIKDDPSPFWPDGCEWWQLQVKKNKYFKQVIWGYICDDMDTIRTFDSKEECEGFIKEIKSGNILFIDKGVVLKGFSDG